MSTIIIMVALVTIVALVAIIVVSIPLITIMVVPVIAIVTLISVVTSSGTAITIPIRETSIVIIRVVRITGVTSHCTLVSPHLHSHHLLHHLH